MNVETEWANSCMSIVREAVEKHIAKNQIEDRDALRGYMAIFEALLMTYALSIEVNKTAELGRYLLKWCEDNVKK